MNKAVFSEGYWQDVAAIAEADFIDFDTLREKTVLITGATGLIGVSLVNTLTYLNRERGLNCKIIAMVRDLDKAKRVLRDFDEIECVVGDILRPLDCETRADFVIHAASDTSSKSFVDNPVGVVNTIFDGTRNVLEYAKNCGAKKVVFLSTMEVYGRPDSDEKISEAHSTNLQSENVRDCYPIAKRAAENLCFCYAKECGFDVTVLRLTQTFGPGVGYADGRVFADFARCVIESRDIVLHTKGDTRRQYLYVLDAVSAILTSLTRAEAGVLNVANEESFCSIREMAELVAGFNGNTKVIVDLADSLDSFGYAPTLIMNLDCTKMRALGWRPSKSLEEMFARLIEYMKDNK